MQHTNHSDGLESGALPEPRHLYTEGYDFKYLDVGQGEPLVLVHGSLLDFRYWLNDIAALAQSHRVIALSRRYHWPNAKPPAEFTYTVASHTDDLIAFLDALNLGPVHLLGHSYGGYMAAKMISMRPDLVSSLILAEPGGPVEGAVVGRSRAVDHIKAADLIAAGDTTTGVAHFMDTVCFEPLWKDCSPLYRRMTLENATTVIQQVREIRSALTEVNLRTISCPTLLMGGADTRSPFPETLDRLEELIPGAHRVAVPGASHLINYDNRDGFANTVLSFLSDI